MITQSLAGLCKRYDVPLFRGKHLLSTLGITAKHCPERGFYWGEDAAMAIRKASGMSEWDAEWQERRRADRLPALQAALEAAREYREQSRIGARNSGALKHARLRLVSALSRFADEGEFVRLDGYFYAYRDDCKITRRKLVPQQKAG